MAWIILNSPAIVFLLIGFVFDLVMYSNKEIGLLLYNIIYWIILVLFGVFAGFDFFLIKYQIMLSGNFVNEETVKDDNKLENVEVKAYQERAESVNSKMKQK